MPELIPDFAIILAIDARSLIKCRYRTSKYDIDYIEIVIRYILTAC